jgi:type II secretory pathway pseudopilin PulG
MNAVAIVVVVVVVVSLIAAVVLLRSIGASPKARYRRELRGIRRIRRGTRGMDPNATTIEPTSGTFSAGS